jgi:hypothetical protein
MRTLKLNILETRRDGNGVLDIIDYRDTIITRQYGPGYYLVMVELGNEEIDFNHICDAVQYVEDTLNAEDQARYYRTQEDLHREWRAPR